MTTDHQPTAAPQVVTVDPGVQPEQEPQYVTAHVYVDECCARHARDHTMMRAPVMPAPLARVGDVIEHGQPIPANVVHMTDSPKRGDGVPWHWRRDGDRFRMGSTADDPCPGPPRAADELASLFAGRWPMTVVEVEPEPQPAEFESYVLPPQGRVVGKVRIIRNHPGPVVLSLPQVPDGAVALTGVSSGATYPKVGTAWGFDQSETGVIALGELLDREESVTVEFAPPREPRTWPKLEDDSAGVQEVEVEGFGQWRRMTPTSTLFGSTDPERGPDRPLSLAQLRELGDVREVLDA